MKRNKKVRKVKRGRKQNWKMRGKEGKRKVKAGEGRGRKAKGKEGKERE